MAFVIRDNTSRLLRAGGKLIAPMSILVAAWLGAQAAVNELQANQIWLEGDSSTIIKWLNNPSGGGRKNIPLIKDIKTWLASTNRCMVSHVFRQANKAADYISKGALLGDVNFYSGDMLPVGFYDILMADCRGIFFIRKK